MRKLLVLFAMLALVVGIASAQTFAPYVEGTVQSAPGANKPDYTAGIGFQSDTKHLFIDANGSFNSANVVSGSGGYTGTLEASGYLKLFGHFLGGGGADWVINTKGFNAKTFINTARESANPFVGAGFEFGRLRAVGTYQLPGKDALPKQRVVKLTGEFKLTNHLHAIGKADVNSYEDLVNVRSFAALKTAAGRVSVAQAGGGLKFLF